MPVGYTVEDKPLKAASAGTDLTFQLFSDATCTALVHSAVVPIEDVSLLVRLKQLTPKNDVKLPKAAELRTTLPGVPVPGPYYLKVTDGSAILVAVNGDCQAQAAGAGGAVRTNRTCATSASP